MEEDIRLPTYTLQSVRNSWLYNQPLPRQSLIPGVSCGESFEWPGRGLEFPNCPLGPQDRNNYIPTSDPGVNWPMLLT